MSGFLRARALDADVSKLPRRLRRALRAEICPGEQIEDVIRPQGISGAAAAREAPALLLLLSSIPLAVWLTSLPNGFGLQLWWGVILYAGWVLRGSLELLGRSFRRQNTAYVITNQRCFRLQQLGLSVEVTDVRSASAAPSLGVQDLVKLHLALNDSRRAATARSLRRRPREAREVRLPSSLRRLVERRLMPQEQIVWLGRPSAGCFLRHAPLDFESVGLIGAGGLATIPLLMTLSLNLFGGGLGPGFSAGILVTAGGVGAASLSVGFLRLWWRICRTVYVLTDRRAFILDPSGRLTTVTPRDLQFFQRHQDAAGNGNLVAPNGQIGFFGIQDVKDLDDLIKQRETRDKSTEVTPAGGPIGAGTEVAVPPYTG